MGFGCTDTTFAAKRKRYVAYYHITMPRTPPTKSRREAHRQRQMREMTCRSIPVEEQPRPSSSDERDTGNPNPEQSPNAEKRQVAFVVEGFSRDTISDEDSEEVKTQLREWLVARGYPAMEVHIDDAESY